MLAREIMNTFFVSVSPSETLLSVAQAMRDEHVGFVCVIDSDGRAVGIITDRDLVTRAVASNIDITSTVVQDVMTPSPLRCLLEDDITLVERTMQDRRVSRILVADMENRLVGVISLAELWQYESPFAAGSVSRHIAEREIRTQQRGGQLSSRPQLPPKL